MHIPEYILLKSLIYFFLVSGTYVLLIKFWFSNAYRLFIHDRNEIQNIHDSKIEVPRFGGIIIIISLLILNFFFYSDINLSLINLIILFSIPLIITSLSEDLYYNVPPKIRLISAFMSCFLFFFFYNFNFPAVQIPYLDVINENTFLLIFFYSVVLVGFINGMNIIDCANGLTAITAIALLSALCYISFHVQDFNITVTTFLFAISLIFFLLFNFPLGRIFLGDSGAYFIGWSIGLIVIIFYGKHPEIPTWSACLLLFYPSFEVIFSFVQNL